MRMMGRMSEIRKPGLGALCALALVCALTVAARAGQDSASDSSSKKAATSKNTTTAHTSTSTSATHSTTSKTAGTTHSTASRKHSSRKKSARLRGQQKIDSDRAEAIQEALIREHYLTGTPTGTWNQASEEAMRRYQADNGWQSKTVPDSRALIKLGLGPSKDGLLNPDSAMTTVPDAPKSEANTTTAHPTPAATTAPAGPPSPRAQSDPSGPQ